MTEEKLELIVDSRDNYLDSPNCFYFHPERLSLVRCLNDKIFDSVVIKNTSVDCLTSMNLAYILRKMKVEGVMEIIISHPLTVMQSYDGKQVEANAKLAGFDDFKTVNTDFVDENTGQKFETEVITCVRPEKNPNKVEVEVSIKGKTKTTTTTTVIPKTKIISTTTTTTVKKGVKK